MTSSWQKVLVARGIVRDTKQAELLAIAVLSVAFCLFLLYGIPFYESPQNAVYQEDIPEDILKVMPADVRADLPTRN